MTTYIIFCPQPGCKLSLDQLECILQFLGISKISWLSILSASTAQDSDEDEKPLLVIQDQQVQDCLAALRRYPGHPARLLLGFTVIGREILKETYLIPSELRSQFEPWEFSIYLGVFRVRMGIGRQQATVDRNFGMLFSGEDIPSDYGPYLEAFGKLPVVQGLIQCLDSNGFGKTTLGIQNP